MLQRNSFFRRRSSDWSEPSNDPLDGRRSQRKLLLAIEDPSLTASESSSGHISNAVVEDREPSREELTILDTASDVLQQGESFSSLVRAGPPKSSSFGNTSLSHSANKTKNTKRVRFSTVQVREFPIGIGDNPAVSRGVPVAIAGWKIYGGGDYSLPLEELEQAHRPPRRATLQLQMGSLERIRMLKEMGYSRHAIHQATKHVNVARAQRQRTVQSLKWARVQEGMESIQRALLNATLRRTAKQRERILLEPYRSSTWTTTSKNEKKKKDTSITLKGKMDMSLSQRLSIIDMTGKVRLGVPPGTVGD
jgi:hypothetical protein